MFTRVKSRCREDRPDKHPLGLSLGLCASVSPRLALAGAVVVGDQGLRLDLEAGKVGARLGGTEPWASVRRPRVARRGCAATKPEIVEEQAVPIDRLVAQGLVVRRRLAGLIPRRFRSVISIDDVMQQTYTDAFVRAASSPASSDGALLAWLTSLARCNLIDALRMLEAEKRGSGRRHVELDNDDSHTALLNLLATGSGTPSRCAAGREARALLEAALEELPENYRRVVRMYDLEGRPVAEIARVLRRSPGATYMMRARAHRRLGELLGSASKYISRS